MSTATTATTLTAWLPIVGGPYDGGIYYPPEDYPPRAWVGIPPREGGRGPTRHLSAYRVSKDGKRVEWVAV